LKINIVVHEPIIVNAEETIFKTRITHPKLDGELYFFHSKNNRDQTLSVLSNSIMEDIDEIVETIKDIVKK
jgi:hypothetical protein